MGKTEEILPGSSLPDRPSASQGENGKVAQKNIAVYSLIGFGLALASLLAAGIVQYKSIGSLIQTDDWVAHTHAVIAELEGAYSGLQQAESGTRGYVATGLEEYVAMVGEGTARADEHLRALRALTSDNPRQQQNLDHLLQLGMAKQKVMGLLVELRRDQGFEAASEELRKGEGLKLMTEIRSFIDAMEAQENVLLEVRKAASRSEARRAGLAILFGTILALGLTLAASWVAHGDAVKRRASEDLARTASHYTRSLIEASLDPLVTISVDGKITDVNEATVQVTGVPRDRLIGSDFCDYFTEPEKARKGYQHVFAQGSVRDYPLAIRHAAGQVTQVLYNANVFRNEAGKVEGVFAAARDVTERNFAEEKLRTASLYTRSLIEASLDPLVTISRDGKITDANEAAEKVTGVPRDRLVGSDFCDYFTDPEKARKGYEHVFAQGSVRDYPLAVRHATGQVTEVLYNATVFRNGSGAIEGVFAAARDVTDLKRTQQELSVLNLTLEQRVEERTAALAALNKELEAFNYAVSHDLRAPLRHIDGFSKLLLKDYSAVLPEGGREYVSLICESTGEMGKLVDDLLNLSRVGRRELSLQVAGLNPIVEEVVAELKADAPDRTIEWRIQRIPFLECDPGLLKQVFANLLSNAVKFTRPREQAVIEVGATEQDGQPVVFVRDNGVGFNMKYADKLFGVFQRLHRQEDFEGTGVGLATVQRIIRKHGGKVWAEAELNQGATFYFTLGRSRSTGVETHKDVEEVTSGK